MLVFKVGSPIFHIFFKMVSPMYVYMFSNFPIRFPSDSPIFPFNVYPVGTGGPGGAGGHRVRGGT